MRGVQAFYKGKPARRSQEGGRSSQAERCGGGGVLRAGATRSFVERAAVVVQSPATQQRAGAAFEVTVANGENGSQIPLYRCWRGEHARHGAGRSHRGGGVSAGLCGGHIGMPSGRESLT